MDVAANHPPSCQGCRGSGWQTGPEQHIYTNTGDHLRSYTTAIPCTHHWLDDDPDYGTTVDLHEYLARHDDEQLQATRERHPTWLTRER